MKKTLLISCVLLLTAVGASAQITDVTETYIKNASFETPEVSTLSLDEGNRAENNSGAYVITADALSETGWTLTGDPGVHDFMTKDATATDNNFGAPGTPSDGDQMLYLRNAWETKTASITQEVTLQAGTYMVTVDSKCISTTGSTATLVAGEESTALTIHSAVPEGWDTAELTFTITEATKVSLGVNISFTGSEGSFLLDNFKLYSIGEFDYNVTKVLANPSFELDAPTGDFTDSSHGAYTITSLSGWTLVAPTNETTSRAVCDLMTKEATATDDNYGLPGTPNDGTYMLYLRNSWASNVASVKQTVSLPAGEYKLTVDNKCASNNTGTGKNVTLLAGNMSKTLTIGTPQGTETTASTVQMLADWTTSDLEFTVEEDGEVTLGVEVTFDGNPGLSVLLDNFQLFSTQDIVVWEMTDAGWGTMILPFAEDVPEGLTLYAGSALTLDTDGSTLTVGTASTSIDANTPYLVKGTEGAYTFTGTPINEEESYTSGMLVGTLVDMTQDDFTANGTEYVLQNHEATDEDEGGLAFYPITSESTDVTLSAYHCYLSTNTNFLALHLPGVATAIDAVESDVIANGAIYDLSGRRVAKAVKGVYIQNGKKVLVK